VRALKAAEEAIKHQQYLRNSNIAKKMISALLFDAAQSLRRNIQ
jgi:hypothetical protein